MKGFSVLLLCLMALAACHAMHMSADDAKRLSQTSIGGILPQIEEVEMRDGVKLFTIVWNPDNVARAQNKHPRAAVMCRSPYGVTTETLASIYVEAGFVAVMQNIRGTGVSGGKFSFFHEAANDDYDTAQWIRAQPFSNGVVYDVGISADGITAYMGQNIHQPLIRSQWLTWAAGIGYPIAYQNGAQRESLTLGWMTAMNAERPWEPSYYDQILAREGFSDWWAEVTLSGSKWKNVNFGAVHQAGWYDIFLQVMLDTWNGYNTLAGPGAIGKQKLLVGPRGHCLFDDIVKFPDDREVDVWAPALSFDLFAQYDNGTTYTAPKEFGAIPKLDAVTLYIMAPGNEKGKEANAVGDYWTTLPAFPKTQPQKLFLNSQTHMLDASPPSTNASQSYLYDPNNPVPTFGGNNLFLKCGPQDQSKMEARSDVLTFTTVPYTAPMALVGRMSVDLWVSSDRVDTDFTVKVTDLYSDGTARLLSDDIIRMRWRVNDTVPVLMKPYEVYNVHIDMWSTAYVFNPGHSLRLDVSSSNHPRFGANPNNGLFVNQKGPIYVANNTVYTSPRWASSITLPIVSLDDIPNNVIVSEVMK